VILGGAHGSLAIARSLAPRGIEVALVANHALPLLSRHVARRFSYPAIGTDLAAHLIATAQRDGYAGAVLFAGGDAEACFIAQNHAPLASVFRLTTPPWDALQRLVDKRLMHDHAAAIGLDVPKRYQPRNRRDLDTMPLRFPLVLKPAVRVAENAFTLAKVWRADDRASLLARFDEAAALVGEDAILLQEFIPGGGEDQFSYAAAFDHGSPVGALVARRRRQYPVDFGYTSTFVETADCPAVEDAGRRFLASLAFTGIAEVEFKFDRRDRRYKILDINARIWTWGALGAAVGIDFPNLAWRLARGETIASVRQHGEAVWIHATRDLIAAAGEMARGRLTPAAWLQSFKGPMVSAAFALDDPLPGLAELPLALWRALAHRLPIKLRDAWKRLAPRRRDAAPAAVRSHTAHGKAG
jgi:predicted ATP-grasp superfamily ATP-dependent carboligase